MWSVRWVASTGSTNADVASAARAGVAEGLAVVAGYQSAGRGRLDRRWEAPPGTSLAVSFLLRPDDVASSRWPWLPLLTGVAVVGAVGAVGAVEQVAGVPAVLKWPNDVLAGGRKLGGILVERVDTDRGPAAVVGVGINLSQTEDQLPDGATSLVAAGAGAVSRDDIVEWLGDRLATWYAAWRAASGNPAAGLRDEYVRRCDTLGRQVRAELPGGDGVLGTAVDVDESGRLVVDTGADRVAISAGDVVHLRPR